jgi:flagellar protein FlaG
MSGVSVSHLVIFIASIVVAAGVAGTLITQVDRVSTSITDQSEGVEEQIETDIEIISDTGSPGSIYNDTDGNLTLYVKNTGDVELDATPDAIDVLIEGSFSAPSNVELTGGAERWSSGSVVKVTVNASLDPDTSTRVTVAVKKNEDTIRFRTPA